MKILAEQQNKEVWKKARESLKKFADMSKFEKYKLVTLIYQKWISYFYLFLFKKKQTKKQKK